MRFFNKRYKSLLLWCVFLVSTCSYAGNGSDYREYFQNESCSDFIEEQYTALSTDDDNQIPSRQVAFEVLILKTDIPNTYNFGITGITSIKKQVSVEPFIGTLLTYQGRCFETMEELISTLRGDPRIEIVGVSSKLCNDNSKIEIFGKTIYELDEDLVPTPFLNTMSNQGQCVGSGIALCLKPQIFKDWRVDLKIFLQNAIPIPKANQKKCLCGLNCTHLSRTRQIATSLPIPNGFFVLLHMLFEDKEEEDILQVPCLGGIAICGGGSKHRRICNQRSIVLILRPTIIGDDKDI